MWLKKTSEQALHLDGLNVDIRDWALSQVKQNKIDRFTVMAY